MIDFHCHLDLYPSPQEIVSECNRRGLYVLGVTTTPSAWEGTSKLVASARRIRIALGLHPELAADASQSSISSTRFCQTRGMSAK